jgi:hypothetical protein
MYTDLRSLKMMRCGTMKVGISSMKKLILKKERKKPITKKSKDSKNKKANGEEKKSNKEKS